MDLSADDGGDALYTHFAWPPAPSDRPYTFVNMAATVDGKIVIGEPGGSARGLGGPTDQMLFRRLQQACDAALIGASTLRASQVIYPPDKLRVVVTRSGNVPLDNRFFRDAPGRAYVAAPDDLADSLADSIGLTASVLRMGHGDVDLRAMMQALRQELGVERLLCEGGADLNFQLLRAGLMDELFLTIAPKLKGGAGLPSIITGAGYPPGEYEPVRLLSVYLSGNELYLRYVLA